MWLINTSTLELEGFQQCPVDTYAILSHTWGAESEELNFDEFKSGEGRHKVGFEKIRKCCELAWDNGLNYAWVDTCCIDRRSNAELSEAINSMFSWYESAKACYVYLVDVRDSSLLAAVGGNNTSQYSRWFTRGWTLQELIAPKAISFYNWDWNVIGKRETLTDALYAATKIDSDVLRSTKDFRTCSIAQRMSWAARRETTRLEDLAYCLLGLFNVNMPLLYGEGLKAFLRLQEELIRHTDDETIFAWTSGCEDSYGLLAPSPSCFSDAADIHQSAKYRERPYLEITNRGLKLECQMLPCEMNTYVVPLQCVRALPRSFPFQIVIFIARTLRDDQYRRVSFQGIWTDGAPRWDIPKSKISTIFVPDDIRSTKLAPRGGRPLIHIVSDMFAWQFPQDVVHEVLQVRDSMSNTFETLPTAKNVPKRSGSTIELARCVLSSESHRHWKSVAICRERNSHKIGIEKWTPAKTTAVQFRRRNIESGVAVAFTRSDSWRHKFYYNVEIGFDKDFLPVCVVYTRPFKLAILSESLLSTLFTRLCWLVSGNPGHVPFWGNFWTHEGCQCLGASSAIQHSLERKRCKVCCLGIPSSWYPRVVQPGCFRPSRMRSQHHELNDVRIARGQRFEGLKMCTDDSLPYSYGCVDMHLSLRHLQGLEWELKVKEVPLHTGFDRYGIFCYQRVRVSVLRMFDKFVWPLRINIETGLRFTVMIFICCSVLHLVLDYYDISHSATVQSIGSGIVVALAVTTMLDSLANSFLLELKPLLQSRDDPSTNSHHNHEARDHRVSHHRLKNTSKGNFLLLFGLATALDCPLQYSIVATIIWCYIASIMYPF